MLRDHEDRQSGLRPLSLDGAYADEIEAPNEQATCGLVTSLYGDVEVHRGERSEPFGPNSAKHELKAFVGVVCRCM